jgi:hypothetical protein
MKPGNDLTVAGLFLFAALCELLCELLNPRPSPSWVWQLGAVQEVLLRRLR